MNSWPLPRIGITANLKRDEKGRMRHEVKDTYVRAVVAAGGIPVLLPVIAALRKASLDTVDGVLLTGGDDIDTRPFGIALHPNAVIMESQRQEADFALLRALDDQPEIPVLGICLGMQEMGVHAGADLIQHLGDVLPNADRHSQDNRHHVSSEVGAGEVASWHHQALGSSGSLQVIGHSDDGVIEAVRHPDRPFYLGVQWHPERTVTDVMGVNVIRLLIEGCLARSRC